MQLGELIIVTKMKEIQRLKEDVPCPGSTEDYVWSDCAADYNTIYYNKELGTNSFTHIGAWVFTLKGLEKIKGNKALKIN